MSHEGRGEPADSSITGLGVRFPTEFRPWQRRGGGHAKFLLGEELGSHHNASVKARFTYWKESDGRFLGYLNAFPEHWTQGETLDDLREHLRDLHRMFSAEEIPGIRKEEELEVA